jgi:hypothetical protein
LSELGLINQLMLALVEENVENKQTVVKLAINQRRR